MRQGVPDSGSVIIPDPGNNTTTPLNAQQYKVVAWRGRERPCELVTSVSWPSDAAPVLGSTLVTYPPAEASALCGSWNAGGSDLWEPYNAGAFIIEYGRNGVYRRMVCDMRSMRLYLGICDSVQVVAYRWRLTAWITVYPSMLVAANVSPATGGAYDEPTATYMGYFSLGAPVSRKAYVPNHARWWTPVVASGQTTPYWGGTNPALYFTVGSAQDVIVDPANYRWVPPLARFECPGAIGPTFTVSSNASNLTTILWIGTRFYLSC